MNHMASLEAVQAKVAWAEKQRKCLEAEAVQFLTGEGSNILTLSCDSTDRIATISGERQRIPFSLPLLIGDCLQSLRSSLDYLVWELILAANRTPARHNSFPVCRSHTAFKNSVSKGQLAGVDEGAIAQIEKFQPYHDGKVQNSNALYVLDDLCGICKHRMVPLTIRFVQASPSISKSSVCVQQVKKDIAAHQPGAERGSISKFWPGRFDEVSNGPSFCLQFDDGAAKGREVCNVIAELHGNIVRDVLPAFRKCFGT